MFRYFNREMAGKEQNIVFYKDDDKCSGAERVSAHAFIVSVLLNAVGRCRLIPR